mmetsp:Transcript_24272/g.79929  ORF Transcript_24272/g.79929 Transcript_24272/m.79929 type:complete len:301 (+) Transcript_24272:598-1500(+)
MARGAARRVRAAGDASLARPRLSVELAHRGARADVDGADDGRLPRAPRPSDGRRAGGVGGDADAASRRAGAAPARVCLHGRSQAVGVVLLRRAEPARARPPEPAAAGQHEAGRAAAPVGAAAAGGVRLPAGCRAALARRGERRYEARRGHVAERAVRAPAVDEARGAQHPKPAQQQGGAVRGEGAGSGGGAGRADGGPAGGAARRGADVLRRKDRVEQARAGVDGGLALDAAAAPGQPGGRLARRAVHTRAASYDRRGRRLRVRRELMRERGVWTLVMVCVLRVSLGCPLSRVWRAAGQR